MIIKPIDDMAQQISELEGLLTETSGQQQKRVEEELRTCRAGLRGEKDAAYFIDFELKDSRNWAIIHDLRIEDGDRVAQIDHLVIDRMLNCCVLETKSFHAGLKITDQGEFLRWNDWKKTFEGLPSPLAQNVRHISVLKSLVSKKVDLPKRMGLRIGPSYKSFILISPKTRIDRPKKFDTSNIVKADLFLQTEKKMFDELGVGAFLMAMVKVVGQDTLERFARDIAGLHRPASFDYRGKFGIGQRSISDAPVQESLPPALVWKSQSASAPVLACRACGSAKLSVQYGKFGYYLKCGACDGNTPIKIGCGQPSHKERIRKEGLKFYRECAECRTSSLYFENAL